MTRPKITVGRWQEYNLKRGRTLKSWSVCDSRGCRIAKVEEMPGQSGDEEHANARAIAAVPALLEALELALAWEKEVPAPYRDFPFIRKAKAALTLAGYTF